MGKISHNDAWPLVVMRGNDQKLDIVYGRGNDFEKLTTQTTIQYSTWTHLAVVVEPRKMKVFINGIQDCQVSTPGNARAILYPVIIGTCPSSIRTRIEHVRDGLDGMISQYKYYTRALSPIHVRVIYDLGPPEAYDVKERWMLKLLSSTKAIIDSQRLSPSNAQIQNLANVLMGIVMFDSDRLSSGAAMILVKVLAIPGVVQDLNLTPLTLPCT